MSVIEIVSLACLFILFLTMFFVVKNHFVLMQLGRQRADGAMMDVQDKASPTANTRLQPRVGEMAPIGRQKKTTSGQRSVYGVWLWSQVHFSIKEWQIAHFLVKTMNNSFQKGWEKLLNLSYTSFFQFPVLLFQATPMASFLDVEILISSPDKIFTFLITALNIRNRKQAEINPSQ